MSSRSLVALGVLALIVGCSERQPASSDTAELAWARAALERNPQLEVVATDTTARTFTVRHRGSGAVSVVSLDKLAAAPIADLRAEIPPAPPRAPAPVPPAATPAAASDATPAASPERAPPAETAPAMATSSGETSYTIEREGGQLRVSGPGVSIVSASSANTRAATASTAAISETPIICEGGRFLHLDRRTIRVNGTAVIARSGCELHITNSTIEASGTALSIQDATVNVANSDITGQLASVDANGRARLFARSSTFRGITRRNDPAEINDQGGNTWR